MWPRPKDSKDRRGATNMEEALLLIAGKLREAAARLE
jgi:hypothetical protein